MQLDFTAIRGNLAEKPLESPVAAFVERDSKEVPVEPKTPQKAPQRATEGHGTSGQQTEDREGYTSPQRQNKPATGANRGIRKGSAFTGWAFLLVRVLGVLRICG